MNCTRLLALASAAVAATIATDVPPAAASSGVVTSTIASNFNGTAIAAGDWIWFNANFKYSGPTNQLVTIHLENVSIRFSDGGTDYDLAVPDSRIHMDPAAADASLYFDEGLATWIMTVPADFGSDIFLGGLAFPVPAGGLPGGISPVEWTADFSASVVPVSVQWKWGAAVYTDFTSDYDLLGVQIVHQGDHAGTPQNYTSFVTGGARGGGGSNYTGSWSGTTTVDLDAPVSVKSSSWTGIKAICR